MADQVSSGTLLDELTALSDSSDYEVVRDGLNRAIQLLEQPRLGLNDSVRAYEVGRALADRCQQLLDAAELRVTELDGGAIVAPSGT